VVVLVICLFAKQKRKAQKWQDLRSYCQEFCEAKKRGPAWTPAVTDATFLLRKNVTPKNGRACGLIARSFAKQNSQGQTA
jgi:hypothetical protein